MISTIATKTLRYGLILAGCFSSFVMASSAYAGDSFATTRRLIVVAEPSPPSTGPILRPDEPSTKARPSVPPGLTARPQPNRPALAAQSLDDLFNALRSAKTEDEARPIDAMIQARFLQSGSATADLLMDRALLAVHGEDMPLALDLLDSVIALKPDYAEAWNKRATLYFLAHDYGKAISDVEMVLRIEPRHYPALTGLAAMLSELGDKKHALAMMKRVLALYPANAEVAKDAAELQTALDGQAL